MNTMWVMGSILAAGGAAREVVTEFAPLHVNAGRLLLVLFFVLLNGFFVAAEFSIVKVRNSQLDQEIEKGNKAAQLARNITTHLDAYLSATQLGITLASIALGVVAEPFVAAMLEPLFVKMGMGPAAIHVVALVISFSFVTFLHVVLGELMPKSLAIRKALPTTLAIARPLIFFYKVFKPAIWLFNGTANQLLLWMFRIHPVSESEAFHTAEELRILVDETEKSKEVTPIEREILTKALDLNDQVARDVMLHRHEVVWLDLKADFKTNLATAIKSAHTRYPLAEGHLDDAVGLVHIKDLMRLSRDAEPNPDLRKIVRRMEVIAELAPLDMLLKRMMERKAHMAMVTDEYGGALGIVTLENILEKLVGEIQDEFDEEEKEPSEFVRLSEDEFEVDGALPLFELGDLTGLEINDPEVGTIGGYVTHVLGHFPEVGERVAIENFTATVTEVDGKTVGKLHFKREPEDEEAERLSA